jgi:transmembrane 9 superfamily protein 3
MVWVLLCFVLAWGDETSHTYEKGEDLILWFNKVVPHNNPQEAYAFDKFPLCRGTRPEHAYDLTLGEALEGQELVDSRMPIKFLESSRSTAYCTQELNHEQVIVLSDAVKRSFWVQMYLDDLPIWANLGQYDEEKGDVLLFTQHDFVISYNGPQVIRVDYQGTGLVRIYDGTRDALDNRSLHMTYSVSWTATEVEFEERFASYLDPGFFENNIHWFSIFNSFVMVLLMCGLVMLILTRTLRKDYARFDRLEEIDALDSGLSESAGWKQISGDVFRPPDYLVLFSSGIGAGCQLAALGVGVLLTCVASPLYSYRGKLTYVVIIMYCFTSSVNGAVSANYYSSHKGKRWIRTMILSALLVPVPLATIGFLLNTIAVIYSSSAAIPFTSMLQILALFCFLCLPIHAAGTIIGRNFMSKPGFPTKVSPVSQPIRKEKSWYNDPLFLSAIGGLMPFGSISVELYFIFTSFWNYKFYYVYGLGALAFLLLAGTLVCVAIVASYFLLNAEDYRWAWVSYASAASTAVYMFLYAGYFYLCKTKMQGFFQFFFYFGYMGMACWAMFLLCGTIGYIGASIFVRLIYSHIKPE